MKKNYIFKGLLVLVLTLFLNSQINAQAQFRIVEVDPATETVKIQNFGNATDNIGAYRLCSLISYRTLSSQTTIQSGSFNLAPGESVTVTVNDAYLNDGGADLGLYLPSGSFGLAANMVDFMQWGSGGNGRENVAVNKGIWTLGTFIDVTPPYQYTGNGSQNGAQFWDSLLSVEDFENLSGFKLYPNPANTTLNVEFNTSIANGSLQVFDILGKEVLSHSLGLDLTAQVDISGWNDGLYLIKITSENSEATKRFIKN
ncbi:T9SS type A sorting domain-containing protein [uncultured Psychroserpens sp.]|uniref:T9SS type A sorting domain-containing protein n=1 Tax=uncultured Psychroserpens sp. TaxID=255436 RepID=UPI00260A5CAD|nr:T9SS type A sorting domain-containing protein [uncultured Psychroserpens sp.]